LSVVAGILLCILGHFFLLFDRSYDLLRTDIPLLLLINFLQHFLKVRHVDSRYLEVRTDLFFEDDRLGLIYFQELLHQSVH